MEKYSAIKEMYYGNRGGHENFKMGKEEKRIVNRIVENEKQLLKKLSKIPEILEIYKKLDDAMCELACIENERCYAEGFRFGFLMAKDVFEI